jgi:hypothetical protein
MRKRKQKCVVPGCNSTKVVGRGLCSADWQAAKRLIEQKKTTWAELEKKGLALPLVRGRRGGRLFSAFMESK